MAQKTTESSLLTVDERVLRSRKKRDFRRKTQLAARLAFSVFAVAFIIAGFFFATHSVVRLSEKPVPVPPFARTDYIDLNEYTRPGIKLTNIKGVVFFEDKSGALADSLRENIIRSSENGDFEGCHFAIGSDGEILCLVPCDEVTYRPKVVASELISVVYSTDDDNISAETKASLLQLARWLKDVLGISPEAMICEDELLIYSGGIDAAGFNPEWDAFRKEISK